MITPAKRNLAKLSIGLFALAVLAVAFTFPKSGLGQRHLQNKASKLFSSTYDEFNKQFDSLPLSKATFNNKYCNELRGRELRAGEADWIQECSRLKIIEINASKVKDFSDRLMRIQQWLANNNWHSEEQGRPSESLAKMTGPHTGQKYIKISGNNECGLIFDYQSFTPNKVFSIYEYCNYHYRNILDL